MRIYIVDFRCPGYNVPSGNIRCVLAKDAASCIRMLVETVGNPARKAFPDYEDRANRAVAHAKSYEVKGDHKEGILNA